MESHGKTATVLVTLAIGLIVGGGVGWAITDMAKNNDNTSASTDSSMAMGDTDGVTVGGAKMVESKDIVDNAVNASNVTTLVSLVKDADLVNTLKSAGPFTVFAPDNAAFAKLPAATVASLQKPENKKTLQTILEDHVVAGTYTSADLKVMAQKGETLKSLGGEVLTPVMQDNALYIKDAMGDNSKIETADVISSNGVTHVIDTVLLPKS